MRPDLIPHDAPDAVGTRFDEMDGDVENTVHGCIRIPLQIIGAVPPDDILPGGKVGLGDQVADAESVRLLHHQ